MNKNFNKFTKQHSLFDPEIDDNHHNITYIGYNIFTWDSLININNYIYLSNLSVTFEYALDYNITYNEGSFVLDYMNFSKIQKDDVYLGNIIYKESNFDNIMPIEESNNIWKIIIVKYLDIFPTYHIGIRYRISKTQSTENKIFI